MMEVKGCARPLSDLKPSMMGKNKIKIPLNKVQETSFPSILNFSMRILKHTTKNLVYNKNWE